MNPYNEISNLDKLIDNLEQDLTYSKNKPKDTKNLNVLINARNSFEKLLKDKYYSDVVEILLYHIYLNDLRLFDVAFGGDILKSQEKTLNTLKNTMSVGLVGKKEVVFDELRKYLDFHAKREGHISSEDSKDKIKAYIKNQDELIEGKMTENINVLKSLIVFNLKNL